MHQQINLFQPVFRQQRKVFSAATLLAIAAAVGVLLALVMGHARWSLGDMQRDAVALEQQLADLHRQMGALEDTYRTPDSTALEAEITGLRERIDQRHVLLAQFDQLVLQHRGGFAGQFQALADIHVPGLWLESVTVSEDKHIEIRGITLDARLVPNYLQLLEKRRDLSEQTFETVSMTRLDPDRPHIQFVLRNREAGDET